MPGEKPIPVSTFPDVLQYISVNLGQDGSGNAAADHQSFIAKETRSSMLPSSVARLRTVMQQLR